MKGRPEQCCENTAGRRHDWAGPEELPRQCVDEYSLNKDDRLCLLSTRCFPNGKQLWARKTGSPSPVTH